MVLAAALIALTSVLTAPAYAEGRFIPAAKRVDVVYDDARGVLYVSSVGEILRYRLSDGSFLPSIATGGSPRGIDLSPDGNSLAVADANLYGIRIVDLNSLTFTNVNFTPASSEGGTFAVAYGSDGSILLTSSFQGSGWVPLRRYVPSTQTMTTIASSVRQDTMVSASADRSVIGFAESNISDGEFGRYRVSDGNLLRKSGYNDGTSAFNYEIAVSRNGQQYVLPVYSGAVITDANLVKQATVGSQAGPQPIGAAYDPLKDLVYFPWATTTQLYVYDIAKLVPVRVYDFESVFGSNGNYAFVNGRTKTSRDGSLLFTTVDGGVRYVTLGVDAPTGLTATTGNGSTTLQWTAVTGASSYLVYVGSAHDTEPVTATKSGITGTATTITGLTNGQTYYFRVAAQVGSKTSTPGNEASATPNAPPPMVQGVSATARDGAVDLSWNSATNATSYKVYGGTAPDGESLLAGGLTTTRYSATGLTDGTTYYFKIVATNSVGDGPASSEVSARPVGAPLAPTALKASPGNGQVTLNWQAATDATSYDVYIGSAAGAEQTSPILANITATQATIVGLSNGQTYYFTVTAKNGVGASPYSNEAMATPGAPASGGSSGGSTGATGGTSSGGTPSSTGTTSSGGGGGSFGAPVLGALLGFAFRRRRRS